MRTNAKQVLKRLYSSENNKIKQITNLENYFKHLSEYMNKHRIPMRDSLRDSLNKKNVYTDAAKTSIIEDYQKRKNTLETNYINNTMNIFENSFDKTDVDFNDLLKLSKIYEKLWLVSLDVLEIKYKDDNVVLLQKKKLVNDSLNLILSIAEDCYKEGNKDKDKNKEKEKVSNCYYHTYF